MEISSQRHESIQEDKQSKDKTDTFGFSQREARRIDILTPAVFERITRFWSLCKYLSKSLFASAACADERSSFARSRTLVPELMWTGVCVFVCIWACELPAAVQGLLSIRFSAGHTHCHTQECVRVISSTCWCWTDCGVVTRPSEQLTVHLLYLRSSESVFVKKMPICAMPFLFYL